MALPNHWQDIYEIALEKNKIAPKARKIWNLNNIINPCGTDKQWILQQLLRIEEINSDIYKGNIILRWCIMTFMELLAYACASVHFKFG